MIPALIEAVRDCAESAPFPADIFELPVPMHSKREIVAAGKFLREDVPEEVLFAHESGQRGQLLEAFRVAHAWRDAHMYPLLRVRQELGGKLRSIEKGAITAARLKRMESIRRKLQRPITLYQMQDIAGCRAVLRSMKEVSRVVSAYQNGETRHVIQDEDDYIGEPKDDGYRSHHLILKFRDEDDDSPHNRQTVEVQIRSRAQHAWATAVEAVGLIRHENIKGGGGDAEWRRFFELMSSEIAYEEDCPICPSANGAREEIHKEIRDLSKRIKAVSTLETYNKAINFSENYGKTYATYFLLQFDYDTKEVFVEPFVNYKLGAEKYIEEEKRNNKRNSVLVEVN